MRCADHGVCAWLLQADHFVLAPVSSSLAVSLLIVFKQDQQNINSNIGDVQNSLRRKDFYFFD